MHFDSEHHRVVEFHEENGVTEIILDSARTQAVELVADRVTSAVKAEIGRLRTEFEEYKRNNNPYVVVHSSLKNVDDVDLVVHSPLKDIDDVDLKVNAPSNKPKPSRVYIAKYTLHDEHGPLEEYEVFSDEVEAWKFVLNKHENKYTTDISVMPRVVN